MIMLPLRELIGPERFESLTALWTQQTMEQDHLPQDAARRVVETRIAAGDPLLLAATGQVWVLADQELLDDAPVMILRIDVMVGYDDPDYDADEPQIRYLSLDPVATTRLTAAPVTLLRAYQLQSWNIPSTGSELTGGAA